MFTHKSLIVLFGLILALACTGILATSAHTAQPTQKQQRMMPYSKGIAAIPVVHTNRNILSLQDVRHYVHARGFVGGSTLNGKAPVLQDLQLTNVLHLDYLLHFLIPEQPDNEQVYYAHFDGPLVVLPDLPLPVLSTLLPSLGNLPAFIPHLGNLSSLGLYELPNILPLPGRMPDLSNLQNDGVHLKLTNLSTVLASAYEIFDAHSGNILAWG